MPTTRSGPDERLYIVTYDISDPRRWRRVYKTMQGYGDWIQLSVFQCRLTRRRRAELEVKLRELVNASEDSVLLIAVGPAEGVELKIECIGRRSYKPIERKSIVI